MSKMTLHRDNIIKSIKTNLSEIKTVEPVKAGITDKEIKRLSVRAPAALVAFMGIQSAEKLGPPNKYLFDGNFGIFLLTSGQDRLASSASILEKLSLHVLDNRFDTPGARVPTDFEAKTLFDNTDDEKGLFMMGVSWRQMIQVDRPDPSSPLARADDVAAGEALGQNSDRTWPKEIRGTSSYDE